MKEINDLQDVATRLQALSEKKENFDMGRIAKGGYIQNGKVHKYRNLITDADKWIKEKTEFLQTSYGCRTLLIKTEQEMKLHAYRKAQGRKKEIEITFILTLV